MVFTVQLQEKAFSFAVIYTDENCTKDVADFSITLADTNTVKKYHNYVNKAELSTLDGNIMLASAYYDTCFSMPVTHFAQDIYNASICALENGDYRKSVKYCLRLVETGCKKEFFLKKAYNGLRSNKSYWNHFQNEYEKHRGLYNKNVDTLLLGKLKKMVLADQNYFCEMPKRLKNNYFLDSLFQNDQYLSNQLSVLFERYGYISEELIGANVVDTTLSIYPVYNVLIRHHYQLKQYELTNILKRAVYEGKLKPDIFCNWYSFEKRPVGYGDELFILKYKCNLYEARRSGVRELIEKNRKQMWLSPLDDLKKKIIYRSSVDNARYIYYAPLAVIPDMNEDSEKNFKMKNSTLPNIPIGCK